MMMTRGALRMVRLSHRLCSSSRSACTSGSRYASVLPLPAPSKAPLVQCWESPGDRGPGSIALLLRCLYCIHERGAPRFERGAPRFVDHSAATQRRATETSRMLLLPAFPNSLFIEKPSAANEMMCMCTTRGTSAMFHGTQHAMLGSGGNVPQDKLKGGG